MFDQQKLSRLYQCMLKIRLVEEKITQLYPTDKIQSPIHLSIGQEAAAAGVCHGLEPTDHIYGTYRSHGLFIAKGGELKKLFAELFGKVTGSNKGKGGSMHLAAPELGLMGSSAIVASCIPVATGDALASQMQGRHRVAAAFFGDGAVDEGVFFESINFAILKNLPILYICENNHYAIHSKVADRRKQTELFRIGEGLGLKGARFDGNDVQVVYSKTQEACREIRKGGGPVLLEFMTYRWCEHVGPGKDHREAYRDQQKLSESLEKDPLQRTQAILEKEYGVSANTIEGWKDLIAKEIEEAVRFAEESPFPGPEELFQDVYGVVS